jgi:hypothetical protein
MKWSGNNQHQRTEKRKTAMRRILSSIWITLLLTVLAGGFAVAQEATFDEEAAAEAAEMAEEGQDATEGETDAKVAESTPATLPGSWRPQRWSCS